MALALGSSTGPSQEEPQGWGPMLLQKGANFLVLSLKSLWGEAAFGECKDHGEQGLRDYFPLGTRNLVRHVGCKQQSQGPWSTGGGLNRKEEFWIKEHK